MAWKMVLAILLAFTAAIALAEPAPNRCGDGRIDRIIDGFDGISGWSAPYRDGDLPDVTLTPVAGCSGGALGVRWDLHGGEWFVLVRDLPSPLDLSGQTHLRLALRGTNPRARQNLQIKLMDGQGHVFWQVAESMTDLPVWRPMFIDLRELTCFGDAIACGPDTALDLADIRQIQIGIALCLRDGAPCEATETVGGLDLDELAAVDLRPGAPHRRPPESRELVIPDPDIRAQAAAVIVAHQDANGLVPAWFPEPSPNYNTYTNAMALLVFLAEWQRSGDSGYRNAAVRLTDALIALQIAPPHGNAGGWMTAYAPRDGAISSFDPNCTGDEPIVDGDDREVNRCSWVGNAAWALLALIRARDAAIPVNAATLDSAIDAATDWLVAQIGRTNAYPDLMTRGLEGNVSSWFAIAAAGRTAIAHSFGEAIFRHGWDPVEQRLKMGAGATDFGSAIDMTGSWGAQFLRRIGRNAEALANQSYAASVFPTTSFDDSIQGVGDIAGPWTPTVEFGAQAAAAGMPGANAIMREIGRLQDADGSFPGGADEWYGGIGTPWTTTMTGVAPTAWVYFAQNGDPLVRNRVRAVR